MQLLEVIDKIKNHGFGIDNNKINSFYKAYLDVFSGCSEAPPKFVLTVLFTALGSAISLKRWVNWGTKRIYPNFWVLILGESTRSRKTTALCIGLYAVKKANEQKPERHYMLPSRSSISALLEILGTEKHGVIEHSEIATFLELLKKGFNCDMKSLLTSFFDVPAVYKMNFITKEDTCIQKPIFSMATASTPVWLKENLKKGDATSGFLARFLFSLQNKKERSIPIPRQPDPERVKKIMENFAKLYALSEAEIKLTPDFEKVYSDFYLECDDFIDKLPFDNGLRSLLGRLQTDYFLKFTILECVLTNKTEAGKEEAIRAKYLVVFYMTQAIQAIKNITPDPQMELEKRIIAHLKENGEDNRTGLYKILSNNVSASKLNSVLTSLIRAEQIEEIKSGNKGKRIYRLISQ